MMTKCNLFLAVAMASFMAWGGGAAEEADASAKIGATLADKSEVTMEEVPAGVLEAARKLRPDVSFSSAEREVRNGVVYYDLEGENPDGSEIELDIMQEGEGWRVVEIQRDIGMENVPAPAKAALKPHGPDKTPDRIIESDQGDGTIIYEFFYRDADGKEEKHEVKYDGASAEYLTEEWAH